MARIVDCLPFYPTVSHKEQEKLFNVRTDADDDDYDILLVLFNEERIKKKKILLLLILMQIN